MPIQDFDVSTGKAVDPRRKQIILALNSEDDLEVAQQAVRERRLHLLGKERDSRAILELMRKFKVGTLVLDTDLPDINMQEFMETVKRQHSGFVLVLASEMFTQTEIANGAQNGVKGFLAKPFKKTAVLNALNFIK